MDIGPEKRDRNAIVGCRAVEERDALSGFLATSTPEVTPDHRSRAMLLRIAEGASHS